MEINSLLILCNEKNASDLHIAPRQRPLLRINGELQYQVEIEILNAETTKKLIYSTMTTTQQNQFENNCELDFVIEMSSIARYRVNAYLETQGIAAVFRRISEDVPTLDQLKLPTILKQLLDSPKGLILVTGPTGSGKSTTLAAMINHLNVNYAAHIITIEDPIEFVHQSKKSLVTQRQIARDTRNFHTALHAALRQDPDVIMLGEMRDLETMRLALTAAETGHLVLATLHTSSASRTINRIIDVFPTNEKNSIRNILSESLQAVICQNWLKENNTRTLAFEIMIATNAIRNLIREDKIAQMQNAIQMGSAVGMCTMEQYLQQCKQNLFYSS